MTTNTHKIRTFKDAREVYVGFFQDQSKSSAVRRFDQVFEKLFYLPYTDTDADVERFLRTEAFNHGAFIRRNSNGD